jgi:hypothetical protein
MSSLTSRPNPSNRPVAIGEENPVRCCRDLWAPPGLPACHADEGERRVGADAMRSQNPEGVLDEAPQVEVAEGVEVDALVPRFRQWRRNAGQHAG